MSTPAASRRQALAFQLLAEGVPLAGIVARVQRQFHCSQTLALQALSAAQQQQTEALTGTDRDQLLPSSISRLQHASQLALEQGDVGACLRAESLLAELIGLGLKGLRGFNSPGL